MTAPLRAPGSTTRRTTLALALILGAGSARAAGQPSAGAPAQDGARPTSEERMARRFPQPVAVSRLLGAAMRDGADRILGRVHAVARGRDGAVAIVIPYGGLFGFGSRLVAVPIEAVAWLGPDLAALDWERPQFELAPTWHAPEGATLLARDEIIRIAITSR